ncbi:2'-5' RNA ligase family protein [Flavobacterium sp. HXWNR69]|uniref:2'-5' RNA ligase family protein n=1 Tax=Flavobacterium fragile TaxID=2949085 RepID=A0ABT0THM3_9FLAO|nr:2'-5' RNA ligase family protein [Flavobacterium sp. HXWNR69]MCL9770397.1 2'-5' RNA ligase family protein [Flavobacterium sp. HXWNR69]
MAKYSVVFQPSESVIEAVKELKEQLSAKIGWYPSKNSLAHVTICEFEYDLTTYENIKSRIANYCRYQIPFEVTFNAFEQYPNGAFFIAPDKESKSKMAAIMKEIPKQIQFPVNHKSSEPHISIGRKLTEDQIKIAYRLFDAVNLNFICIGITIRIFNPDRKQYDVLETIPFLSEIEPEKEQLTLF